MLEDTAMGLIQSYLHEKFGAGYGIDVMRDSQDPCFMLVRIRKGNKGEPDAIACNARMLWLNLSYMIQYKTVQQQIEDAIYGAPEVNFILTEAGSNTCDHIFEIVNGNSAGCYAWNENNKLD